MAATIPCRSPLSEFSDMALVNFLDMLADAAAAAILPHFRNHGTVNNKYVKGFDPVTEADRAGERAMRALIEQHYPHHGILGEEFGAKSPDADDVWVLDPIDGTRSFICGVPVWGTLIGLRHKGVAALGMMAQPFTGERFIGDGTRAWYQRSGDGPLAHHDLKTRACAFLSEATLFTTSPALFTPAGKSRYRAVEKNVRLARYGIDCYAYCMLASGHADLVIESGLNAYDIAALIPIIEGAGGRVTTWTGENAADGGSILASGDPRLHDQVLDILSRA